jgi:ADP-heptose:LPS heptosyltransferase
MNGSLDVMEWFVREPKVVPQTVLIYRLGSLGDTVVALPALRLVAEAFPHARRVMLTNYSISNKAAPMAEILAGTGLVDEYIEYKIKLRSVAELLALRDAIAKLRPDALVYLAAPRGRFRALRDYLFFHLCGLRRQIGVPLAARLQSVNALGDGTYEREASRLLRCISPLGPSNIATPNAFDLALSAHEQALAEAWLGPAGEAPVLALSVGTKLNIKDWGAGNWRALIGRLAGECPGYALVLLGAAIEREDSDVLARLWSGPAINLCGDLSVRESAAVLARAVLFLGHDSGPMHLAAAAGTTCIAIFSSRNLPGEWFPYGEGHKIFYRQMDCQGCRLDICTERAKACILSITVDEVALAVRDVLKQPISQKRTMPMRV